MKKPLLISIRYADQNVKLDVSMEDMPFVVGRRLLYELLSVPSGVLDSISQNGRSELVGMAKNARGHFTIKYEGDKFCLVDHSEHGTFVQEIVEHAQQNRPSRGYHHEKCILHEHNIIRLLADSDKNNYLTIEIHNPNHQRTRGTVTEPYNRLLLLLKIHKHVHVCGLVASGKTFLINKLVGRRRSKEKRERDAYLGESLLCVKVDSTQIIPIDGEPTWKILSKELMKAIIYALKLDRRFTLYEEANQSFERDWRQINTPSDVTYWINSQTEIWFENQAFKKLLLVFDNFDEVYQTLEIEWLSQMASWCNHEILGEFLHLIIVTRQPLELLRDDDPNFKSKFRAGFFEHHVWPLLDFPRLWSSMAEQPLRNARDKEFLWEFSGGHVGILHEIFSKLILENWLLGRTDWQAKLKQYNWRNSVTCEKIWNSLIDQDQMLLWKLHHQDNLSPQTKQHLRKLGVVRADGRLLSSILAYYIDHIPQPLLQVHNLQHTVREGVFIDLEKERLYIDGIDKTPDQNTLQFRLILHLYAKYEESVQHDIEDKRLISLFELSRVLYPDEDEFKTKTKLNGVIKNARKLLGEKYKNCIVNQTGEGYYFDPYAFKQSSR